MRDIEQALSEISNIRASMAAATRFRGYAPEILLALAAMAALLALAQMVWPEVLAADNLAHVIIWGGFLVISDLAMVANAIARTPGKHGTLASAMLSSALGGQLPFLAVGAIVAIGVCRFALEAAWIVPGIWQLLMALVAITQQAILPRRVVWAGGLYLLTGTLAIVLAGGTGQFAGWMMGIPLSLGHLFIAWILWTDSEGALHG